MKRNKVAETFVAHSKEMRESPAWRAIPDTAKRVLERLELEHMRHAGTANGSLKVTFDQFAEAGIRRQSVSLALRQLTALGFIEVTLEGYRGQNGFHVPSQYRLTHVYNADKRRDGLPTHEWRRIGDDAQAQDALQRAAAAQTRGSLRSGRGRARPTGASGNRSRLAA